MCSRIRGRGWKSRRGNRRGGRPELVLVAAHDALQGRGIVILADRHGADARDVDEGQAALFRPGIELLLNFLAVALRSRVLGDLHAGVAQAEDHVARRDPAVAAEEADQILPGIATEPADRKSTRLHSSHSCAYRMPYSS